MFRCTLAALIVVPIFVLLSPMCDTDLDFCEHYGVTYIIIGPGGNMVIYVVNLLPPPVFSTPGTLH